MKTFDVAIVGGGPVGVVAAHLCGIHGLSAVVFEREADVYDLPRAAVLYDDAQRILDGAGLLEAILPHTGEVPGAEFVDAAGVRIVGIDVPPGFVTDNGQPVLRNFSQPDAERAFRACLATRDGVELHTSHEVRGFEDRGDRVAVEVGDLASGQDRQVEARWLLGCDGARSSVRKACGIAWNSLGYDCDWLVIDLELTQPVELTGFCQQICDPDRPVTVIPMPGRLRRWEFQLKPGESRDEMEDPARVWQLLAPWLAPDQGRLVRAVVYRFHATIASTFQRHRVFLAGDAAHQTPPFMGQGLCTGLRDVDNLIWKLAMVEGGRAADGLLDTYTAERHPLAVAMVEHSTNTGKLIDAYAAMARGGPEPPPELREYAYGGNRRLPDLSGGLLALGDSDWVGRLIPWARVRGAGGDGPLDDVVGPRWAVLANDAARDRLDDGSRDFLREIGAQMVSIPEPEGAILGLLLTHEAVIARPDRVIYGVASAGGLSNLVARLRADLGVLLSPSRASPAMA